MSEDSEHEDYINMQDKALTDLGRIASHLYYKSDAAYTLGMKDLGDTLHTLQNQLADAIDLIKKANDLAFDAYTKTVNQGTKNTLAAGLAMAEIAINQEDKEN